MSAFGDRPDQIGGILILNLDRQPIRLRRTLRELGRLQTADGKPLTSITSRVSAVDAKDGRAVAATSDVDPIYKLSDQLHVQPDAQLEECFGADQIVRMTRQEIAVARSHVEAWKTIAFGTTEHVLVLEDDVWFRAGAAASIDRGWREAVPRDGGEGLRMLYLSYEDAGGTCQRINVGQALFRPLRGLWFLSGYVLSREGAATLLKAMPVVGPVDVWINRQFDHIRPLALRTPVILQRVDSGSDNSYSVLPFLAQAGVIDADAIRTPSRTASVRILAWTAERELEPLPMALSMLGLRVRKFDRDSEELSVDELEQQFDRYDALVDAKLTKSALSVASMCNRTKFILEPNSRLEFDGSGTHRPPSKATLLTEDGPGDAWWSPLSSAIEIEAPIQPFPVGPPSEWRIFREDVVDAPPDASEHSDNMDDSAWAIARSFDSNARRRYDRTPISDVITDVQETLTTPTPQFHAHVGTFPGNKATFTIDGVVHGSGGAAITIEKASSGDRPYRSGALVSDHMLLHGRVEARIKPARGKGLVTGFFLHRGSPRQEIDIEFTGDDPCSMLVNVYFNPGDEGTSLDFGYRGSPSRIDLGFDASLDFHTYSIEWQPDRISWFVDGALVHERGSWDTTPIPHLPMKLHANLWPPRSESLAGRIGLRSIPSTAMFKDLAIYRFREGPSATPSIKFDVMQGDAISFASTQPADCGPTRQIVAQAPPR